MNSNAPFGMACPKCGKHYTRVLDSRSKIDLWRRRRECKTCKTRFTTYEVTPENLRPEFLGNQAAAHLRTRMRKEERLVRA
jgi:transcriptional regulator NrdR family protein